MPVAFIVDCRCPLHTMHAHPTTKPGVEHDRIHHHHRVPRPQSALTNNKESIVIRCAQSGNGSRDAIRRIYDRDYQFAIGTNRYGYLGDGVWCVIASCDPSACDEIVKIADGLSDGDVPAYEYANILGMLAVKKKCLICLSDDPRKAMEGCVEMVLNEIATNGGGK